jgi:succinate dehydrogenase/fumarate reductase-like Fe-S protein
VRQITWFTETRDLVFDIEHDTNTHAQIGSAIRAKAEKRQQTADSKVADSRQNTAGSRQQTKDLPGL